MLLLLSASVNAVLSLTLLLASVSTTLLLLSPSSVVDCELTSVTLTLAYFAFNLPIYCFVLDIKCLKSVLKFLKSNIKQIPKHIGTKYTNAGTAKPLDYMKTEDFFNKITAAGGNYRFNSNGTPLLPAPKYAVSFVVTPAELANVVIKVNGQEVANPVDLEAGTYTVEVSADNGSVPNSV